MYRHNYWSYVWSEEEEAKTLVDREWLAVPNYIPCTWETWVGSKKATNPPKLYYTYEDFSFLPFTEDSEYPMVLDLKYMSAAILGATQSVSLVAISGW